MKSRFHLNAKSFFIVLFFFVAGFFGNSDFKLFSVVLAQSLPSLPTATTFSRALSLGMNGPDVYSLQILLNSDPETRISQVGIGSPGQETSYFGQKTAAAVTKFQQKYKKEVLDPAGLQNGTGFFGKLSMNKANSLVLTQKSNLSVSKISDNTKNDKAETLKKLEYTGTFSQKEGFTAILPNDVLIFGFNHDKIRSGDMLAVVGAGFDANTRIHIGNWAQLAEATSSSEILLKMPELPAGSYDVWVENALGSSKKQTPKTLVVGAKSDTRPSIVTVFPYRAHADDIINVAADAFDSYGNNVYSSLGIIRSVFSPDGKTLSFKVRDLPNAAAFLKNDSLKEMPVTFGIGTKNGLSLNYGYFILSK